MANEKPEPAYEDHAVAVEIKAAIDDTTVSVPFLKQAVGFLEQVLSPDDVLGTIVHQYLSGPRKPEQYMQIAAFFNEVSGRQFAKEPEKTANAIRELRGFYGEEVAFVSSGKRSWMIHGAVGPQGTGLG